MNSRTRILSSAIAALSLLASCATSPRPPLEINLVGINDFHGHLDATKFEYTSVAGNGPQSHLAGGVDNIAAALQAWRRDDPDLLFVGAGDLIGGSPAMSAMWADEPTLTALTMAGMLASSVGNHEFDKGRAELLRQQHGGCVSTQPEKACQFAPAYRGAGFTYLAANVLDSATGKPFLPPARVVDVKGIKVGLIGAVLKDTPSVVLASGIEGLKFIDEAEAINAVMPGLRAQGASVFVLMIHEGGSTSEPFDQPDCSQLKGPVVGIAKRLDPAIRLIISGHSHTGFQCKVDGRTITQAEMGGHVVSRIKMRIDPASKAVLDIGVRNVVIKPGQYPPHAQVAAYLVGARARSQQALAQPLARVAVRSMNGRSPNPAGELALGNVIADALLDATRGDKVQITFMNQGGIRKDLDVGENLTATYGQVQVVLPFGNTLVLMDMTGAQIRTLLEQQWQRPSGSSMLQISRGFTYRWDSSRPIGQRVVPGSIKLNGVALSDSATYRIGANNFLSEGGDNFPIFKQARNKIDTQMRDFDLLVAYLIKNDKAGTPIGLAQPAGRIERVQ